MKNTDYEKATNLLRHIDSISTEVEMVKEQWSALMNEGGTAKLFVYSQGKTYETILTENTLNTTFNTMLQKYRESIKNAQEELDKIIASYTPVE